MLNDNYKMQITFQVVTTDGRVAWEELHELSTFEEMLEKYNRAADFAADQKDIVGVTAFPSAILEWPGTETAQKIFDSWWKEAASRRFEEEIQE